MEKADRQQKQQRVQMHFTISDCIRQHKKMRESMIFNESTTKKVTAKVVFEKTKQPF